MNRMILSERPTQECRISLGVREHPSQDKLPAEFPSILPVFLPFAGCTHRCIFCAQDRQTGISEGRLSLTVTLAKHFATLHARRDAKKTPEYLPMELAFYGGTFTAIPDMDRRACLDFADVCRQEKLVCRVRCSTRPDEVSPVQLLELQEAKMDLVELGVQSFHDAALEASRRGYTGDAAREGCRNVVNAGLKLGIQLLPGMPGSTPEGFLEDVQQALALHPACLRFYPCLVVDGTPLAELWRRGRYAPWDSATTVAALGAALAVCWQKGVPVIRLSLAPEASLDAAVLAGPRHPALGSMIQGEALIRALEPAIVSHGRAPDRLLLPSACRGFFSGHRGGLLGRWEELGVFRNRILWTNDSTVAHLIWNIEMLGLPPQALRLPAG